MLNFTPRRGRSTPPRLQAPLSWKEVNAKLDLKSFTIRTMPERLVAMRADPLVKVLQERPDLVAALAALQKRF